MKLLRVIFILLFFQAACFSIYAQSTKPNFVFILTDDQSYGMMGCTGNKLVKTPHLDKLAKEGILFTKAHITSAICTPSRISILLSQYERKHGVNFNSGTSVLEEAWAKSYPVVMREAGYYTGWIGKNHAPVGEGGYESGLMEKSFDYWYAGHGHLSFYPKDRHKIFNDAISHTQVEVIEEGVDDFLDPNERNLTGAIRFLEERPDDKPFMLSLCFNLPHSAGTGSMKLKPEDDDLYKTAYRDQEIPLPKNYVAKTDIVNPKLTPDLLRAEDRQVGYNFVDTPATLKERYTRQLQAMTGIDRWFGHLREKLKSLKLDENTIIIFTSDHGLFMGEYGLGGKALCYEKTTHVPLIVYDPRAPKEVSLQASEALVQSIDIAPTMLSLAGIDIPSSFQGKDFSHLLEGKKGELREYVFTENLWSTQFGNPRCEAVQDKRWKYIRYYQNSNFSAKKKIETAELLGIKTSKMLYAVHDGDIAVYRDFVESPMQGEKPVYEELYDLEKDPDESQNLVRDSRYKQELLRLKDAWESEIRKARGTEKPKVLRYTVDSQMENIGKGKGN